MSKLLVEGAYMMVSEEGRTKAETDERIRYRITVTRWSIDRRGETELLLAHVDQAAVHLQIAFTNRKYLLIMITMIEKSIKNTSLSLNIIYRIQIFASDKQLLSDVLD